MDSENIVVWNVRGLNGRACRDVVASLVQQGHCWVAAGYGALSDFMQ
jgi:hypothetical protein